MFDRKKQNKEYKKTPEGKNAITMAQKRYMQTEKGKAKSKKYSQSEKGKNKRKERRQSYLGKSLIKTAKAKRRQLGFISLNNYFEGSEAHHISENFVIYMLKELHKSLPHNIWTWHNMEQMNKLAIKFL